MRLSKAQSEYFNHRRIESQARPKILAWLTCSSATTGNSVTVLPSATIFSVPTLLLICTGATNGSLRSSTGFIFSAMPFGTVT